jgi:hypothetical protein
MRISIFSITAHWWGLAFCPGAPNTKGAFVTLQMTSPCVAPFAKVMRDVLPCGGLVPTA